jgi:hypothetical protein
MPARLNVQIRKVMLGVMLGGVGLFLCLGAGSLPVSRAQPAGTPEPAAAQPLTFTYSPIVANLIAQVQSAKVYSYTARLSGDVPIVVGGQTVTLTTRHTNSGLPIQQATQYVYEQLQAAGLSVSYHTWTACGTSGRNVIGVITGTVTPSEIVLITAHLDDMPSPGRAPGADDNASGSVGVLLAAQLMRGVTAGFERTLRFVLFTGEEQGLCGSGAYAAAVLAAGDHIVAVYNLDMIAWDGTGGPIANLYTRNPSNSGYAADLAIAGVFTNVVQAYGLSGALVPDIISNGMGSSDHASFWAKGYPAILAIEDYPDDFNPNYHAINDTLSHINLTYYTNYVKASVGAVAHLARLSNVTLTVTTTGTGQGVVSAAYGSGAGLLPGPAQLSSQVITNIVPGTIITLTAVPSTTSVFAGWSGAVTGLTNPATVTMNADKVAAATFTIETVTYLSPFNTGQWYTFGAGCGGVYFTSTGSIEAITLTARYVYPGSLGGGLPRRYDIEQYGGDTYQAQVQLCYNHDDLTAAGIPLESEGNLHAYHYSTGSWVECSTVDTANNTVTASPATLAGVWGLGISTNKPNAVTLQKLSASAHDDSNGLVFFAALFALLGLGLGASLTRRV